MSPSSVTGLLFAAILINMKSVECSIKTSDAGTSKSQKIMSVHHKCHDSIWEDVKDLKQIFNAIYPGTNWCGVGNVTKITTHYVTSVETDKCCQEHDGCETYINAGETKYGLTNNAHYKVSGCDCDQKFLECLAGVATSETVQVRDKRTAKDFGKIFFNAINPICLGHDHPIRCRMTVNLWSEICIQYERDINQPKVWQFAAGKKFPL